MAMPKYRHPSVRQAARLTTKQLNELMERLHIDTPDGKHYMLDVFKLAKQYGAQRGHRGGRGGWIYNTDGNQVVHGWGGYWRTFNWQILLWWQQQVEAYRKHKEQKS